MKKLIFLILCFMIGNTVVFAKNEIDYKLNIYNNNYSEEITIRINDYKKINNGDDPNTAILNLPIYLDKAMTKLYDKNVVRNGNDYTVTLKANYNEYQLKNNFLLNFCFENNGFSYDKDKAYFNILSKNYCAYAQDIKIVVNTDLKVYYTNGKKTGDTTYEWNIGENTNIKFYYYKNYKYNESVPKEETPNTNDDIKNNNENNKTNTLSFVIIGIVLALLTFSIIFLYFKYKKNKKNNKI